MPFGSLTIDGVGCSDELCEEVRASMGTRNVEKERNDLEEALKNRQLDFSATYLIVRDLHSLIETHPQTVTYETISVLKHVLVGTEHSSQKQSFFLYRGVADALASLIHHAVEERLAEQGISALQEVIGSTSGTSKRAATEALGSLPLSIEGPAINEGPMEDVPTVRWEEIIKEAGRTLRDVPQVVGRSLTVPMDPDNGMLVLKLAGTEDSIRSIHREAAWMEHLCSGDYCFPVRFDVPLPLKIQTSYVFRLESLPRSSSDQRYSYPGNHAIAFITQKDYFAYPNDHIMGKQLPVEHFREVMFRNSWLLGKLTSLGMVHSAPIPLFHNRVQTHRRADNGIYQWPRGGRLDRWLHSCRYPNFGVSGLRDFEHFITSQELGRKLYQSVGNHLLSLSLVAGSYFRHKNPHRVGFDERGNPVDARESFDKALFKELIQGIFLRYYDGFVGSEYMGEMPFDLDELTFRMIQEMGVDRHMEEILRVADQKEMMDEEFKEFLVERGYSREETEGLERGVKDLVIHTGPHLGGFNERISLPEFIEFVATASSLCITGRYRTQNEFEIRSTKSETISNAPNSKFKTDHFPLVSSIRDLRS
jgi:hypothetical protein